MSFSEKLQSLRKANKLSQEQLADMLDVTRQSVSKWESGQTYPEMDKLLAMCKIFKCSLDDLTNDEVTDIKIEEKKKNNITNLVDSTLDLINRTHNMFRSMNGKEIAKCIFTMILVALVLCLFRIPVEGLESAFSNIISNIGNNALSSAISDLFNLTLDICYSILFVLIYIYIFKISYLDRWQIDENIEIKPEKQTTEEKKEQSNIITPKVEKQHSYALLNILGSISMYFVKAIVCCFSLPFIISLFFLCAALLITFILLLKGVFYLGILFGILFGILLNILVLELIFNFLFNKKSTLKRILITFLVSISGLGLSFGICMIDFANTEYIDDIPENTKVETIEKEVTMTEELELHHFYNVKYEVDENIKDKIKISITYYPDYLDIGFANEDIAYFFEKNNYSMVKNMMNLTIKNLAKRKIYNYPKLVEPQIIVQASSKNIQKLKENLKKYYEDRREEQWREEVKFYENKMQEYQYKIQELEQTIAELELKNSDLDSEVEEYKRQLQEYKDEIKNIIGEN